MPGALLALVLGAGTIWLMGTLSPQWKLEKDQFRADVLVQTLRNLAPGRTEFDIGRFYLSARGRDGQAFTDVQIVVPELDIEDEVENIVLVADRVDIGFDEKSMLLKLTNARTVNRSRSYAGGTNTSVPLDLIFERKQRDATRAKYRTTAALLTALETEDLTPEQADYYEFEIHRRWSIGVTYFLFLLIGMPTGLWLRSGTQLTAFGAASAYAFTYYILSLQLGKSLAKQGAIDPQLAAWSTNAIGLVVGLLMMWRILRR
jgi:lipopolysaccharide export LptBFGC system permease protein LptF